MAQEIKAGGLADRILIRQNISSVFALLFGVLLTFLIWQLSVLYNERLSKLGFDIQVENTISLLKNSMSKHFNLLVGLQGFFHATEKVERNEFHNILRAINVKEGYPGVHGLSWNPIISVEHTSEFEQTIRSDTSLVANGYPEFSVRPAGTEYKDRVVVSYIEPMIGNEGAFGFDIGSDPIRRLAVEKARDSGQAVATAQISLVQSEGEDSAGFLYMLPVYSDPFTSTQAVRNNSFEGVVVAIYSIVELVNVVDQLEYKQMIINDVTDSRLDMPGEQLFKLYENAPDKGKHFIERKIEIGGRTWLLTFTSTQAAFKQRQSVLTWVIVLLGGLSSLLAGLLTYSMANSRRRAVVQAAVLTRDLKIANNELSRSNSDLSRLAYVASHDLQTPVRNIESSVQLLEDELGKDQSAAVSEYFDYLKSTAVRMKTLLEDLLEHAQIGRDELVLMPVNLNVLLNNVIKTMNDEIHRSNTKVNVGVLPMIKADELKVERIFQNLISNAIKYRHSTRLPVIDISARKVGEYWLFSVKDNGQGIETKYHEIIFEPFRRLQSHDQTPGSGLGLGIVRQLVRRHGGEFELASSDPDGSLFEFTLHSDVRQEPGAIPGT